MRCLAAWVATLLLLFAICGTASSSGLSEPEINGLVDWVTDDIRAAQKRPTETLAWLKSSDRPSDKDVQSINARRKHDPALHALLTSGPVRNHRELIAQDFAKVKPADVDLKSYAINYYNALVKHRADSKPEEGLWKRVRFASSPINELLNDWAFSRHDYIQFSYILAREAQRLGLIPPEIPNQAILSAARKAALDWNFVGNQGYPVIRTIPAVLAAMQNPSNGRYNHFLALIQRFTDSYRKFDQSEKLQGPLPPDFVHLKAHLGLYPNAKAYIEAIKHELRTGRLDQDVLDPYNLVLNTDLDGKRPADYNYSPMEARNLFDHADDLQAVMRPARQPGPVPLTALQDNPSRVQGSKQSALREDGWHFDTAPNHEIRDAWVSLTWSRQHPDSARGKASTSSDAAQYPTEAANPLHQQQMDAYGGHPSTSSSPDPVKYRDNDMDFDLNTVPLHEESPSGTGAAPVHVKEEPEHGYVHVKEEPEHGYGYPVAGSSYPYSGAAHSDIPMYDANGGASGSKRSSGNRMQGSTSNAGFNWPASGYGEQYHYDPYAGQPYPPPGYNNPHARGY